MILQYILYGLLASSQHVAIDKYVSMPNHANGEVWSTFHVHDLIAVKHLYGDHVLTCICHYRATATHSSQDLIKTHMGHSIKWGGLPGNDLLKEGKSISYICLRDTSTSWHLLYITVPPITVPEVWYDWIPRDES